MESEEVDWFVGIDWGSEAHVACVVDARGAKIEEKSFEHSGEGLAALCSWITAVTAGAVAARVAVVIELVRGAVVATLLERGHRVWACNPKQLDRFRDRFSLAGAKDDRRDAFVLASAGRTDRMLLREVPVDGPDILELRELSRLHQELTGDLWRLENRAREQLVRYYPQMLRLGNELSEPWLSDLWERAPTPDDAKKLRAPGVQLMLKRHRIRRVTGEEVVATLREPKLEVAPGATKAAVIHLRALLPQLRTVRQQLRAVGRQIDDVLERLAQSSEESEPGQKSEQRDVTILQQLPGVGRLVLATLLAEAWQALRDRDYAHLRALCGTAPVTRQTGRRPERSAGRREGMKVVSMRRACSTQLRNAAHHWAGAAIQHYPEWRRAAAELRARGKSDALVRRIIANRLLRIACACLRDGTRYDEKRCAAHAA